LECKKVNLGGSASQNFALPTTWSKVSKQGMITFRHNDERREEDKSNINDSSFYIFNSYYEWNHESAIIFFLAKFGEQAIEAK